MSNRWALLFVLMHIAGFSGAATAQTLDQQRCAAPDPDVAILSCTAIIQSGHETQQNLANTYTRRGTAYARKGQNDRAIEDFDEAIRINPNRADAFNNRGLAKRAKGDSAGGDADIAKAKQLNPNVAPALADSKSSAENCLAAIDGIAKVAVIAQENNWITTALATGGCLVTFPGKNVKRDDFFNLISASVDLTFLSDTRLPQQRGEWYEIKSDRTNKLVLNIMSQSDGTLIAAGVSEMPRFAPRQVASPEVDRTPALADSKSYFVGHGANIKVSGIDQGRNDELAGSITLNMDGFSDASVKLRKSCDESARNAVAVAPGTGPAVLSPTAPNSLTDPKSVPTVTIRSDQAEQKRIEDDRKRAQSLPAQPPPLPAAGFGPPPNTFTRGPVR
jgi:tetratricopeptide (TPR) repeat protein